MCYEHLVSRFAKFHGRSIWWCRIRDRLGQNVTSWTMMAAIICTYFSNHFHHLSFSYVANFISFLLCPSSVWNGPPSFSNLISRIVHCNGIKHQTVLPTDSFWFTFNLNNLPRDTGCSSGGPEWRWWMVNKIKLNADPEWMNKIGNVFVLRSFPNIWKLRPFRLCCVAALIKIWSIHCNGEKEITMESNAGCLNSVQWGKSASFQTPTARCCHKCRKFSNILVLLVHATRKVVFQI